MTRGTNEAFYEAYGKTLFLLDATDRMVPRAEALDRWESSEAVRTQFRGRAWWHLIGLAEHLKIGIDELLDRLQKPT